MGEIQQSNFADNGLTYGEAVANLLQMPVKPENAIERKELRNKLSELVCAELVKVDD